MRTQTDFFFSGDHPNRIYEWVFHRQPVKRPEYSTNQVRGEQNKAHGWASVAMVSCVVEPLKSEAKYNVPKTYGEI